MSVNSSVITHDPAALLQDWHSVASLIDHTLLSPSATRAQVVALCAEAVRYGFYSVMVNPAYGTLAAAQVHGSPVRVGTVIGFPLGANLSSTDRKAIRGKTIWVGLTLQFIFAILILRVGYGERVMTAAGNAINRL